MVGCSLLVLPRELPATLHLCLKQSALFNAVNKDCAFEKERLKTGKVTSWHNATSSYME